MNTPKQPLARLQSLSESGRYDALTTPLTDLVNEPWTIRAHRIIAECARAASLSAGNSFGIAAYGKRHKPYTMPPLALSLLKCLNSHNRKSAERAAKRLMLDYNSGLPSNSPLLAPDVLPDDL